MLTKIFAVWDSKAEAYMQPQYYLTSGLAERAFTASCRSQESAFNSNPQDFCLFELGTFDDSCAKFEMLLTPRSVITALQAKSLGDTDS